MEKNKPASPAGRTGKYFKYAIGEIILVVIGILVALSINNWNEDRNRARAESQALVELMGEFKKNHKDLMRVYYIKKRAEDKLRAYLEFINNDSIPDFKKHSVSPGLGGNTWNTKYTVLNGLINSGAINNIRNDSLKILLNTWNDFVDDYLSEQTYYQNIILRNYNDYMVDKVPIHYRLADSTYSSWTRAYFESEVEINNYVSKVVHSVEYQNLLKEALHYLYVQVFLMQPLNNNYHRIVSMLQDEIQNSK
jgi:hypothetical protein